MPEFITAAPGYWLLWLVEPDSQGTTYLKDPIVAWEVGKGCFTAVVTDWIADPEVDEFLGILGPDGQVVGPSGSFDWYARLGL